MQRQHWRMCNILLMIVLVSIGMLLIVTNGRLQTFWYQSIEVPRVQALMKTRTTYSLLGMRAIGQPEDFSAELLFDVPGKGRLALFDVTAASFTGTGELIITGIGDCRLTPKVSVHRGHASFEELAFSTVDEVVTGYDRIYDRMTKSQWYCFHDGPPEPTHPLW